MREILFKAKRIDNGEWVEGYYYESKISGCYILTPKLKVRKKDGIIVGDSFDVYKVDPETICQYTGLTDMNGQKIYEGDWVKIGGHDECVNGIYEVKYIDVGHYWGLQRNPEYHYSFFSFSDLNGFAEFSEVIGNIFDNPELLEVE